MLATVCDRHKLLVPVGEQCPGCVADDTTGTARRGRRNIALGRNTAHWRRISRRRIRLVGGLCEIELDGCTGEATTCDLIGGGDHSRARLTDTRAACRSCHGRVDGGRR